MHYHIWLFYTDSGNGIHFTKWDIPPAPVNAFFSWSCQGPKAGAFPNSESHFLTVSALWLQVKLDSSTIMSPLQIFPVVSLLSYLSIPLLWAQPAQPAPELFYVGRKTQQLCLAHFKSSLSLASNGHSMLPSRPFIFLLWPQFPKKTILCLLSRNLLYSFLHSQMMTSHFMDKIEKLSSLQQTCNLHQGSSSPPWLC